MNLINLTVRKEISWERLETLLEANWLTLSSGQTVQQIQWYTNSQYMTTRLRMRTINSKTFTGSSICIRGQVADVFGPGMYTLETANLPVLSTLKGWKYGLTHLLRLKFIS